MFLFSAPAAVSEVTVGNDGRSDAVQVSWHPAEGMVDSYLVRLQDRTRTIHTLAVSRSSPPECSFSSLVAGRLYTVIIATRSGSLENITTVQTRTREEETLKQLCCTGVQRGYKTFVLSSRTCDCSKPDSC